MGLVGGICAIIDSVHTMATTDTRRIRLTNKIMRVLQLVKNKLLVVSNILETPPLMYYLTN